MTAFTKSLEQIEEEEWYEGYAAHAAECGLYCNECFEWIGLNYLEPFGQRLCSGCERCPHCREMNRDCRCNDDDDEYEIYPEEGHK